MIEIIQLPALTDNYTYLLHDPRSRETAVIDPATSQPILDILNEKKWPLKYILNTHHHFDHIGGNLELKQKTNCQILTSKKDLSRIPGADKVLKHNDQIQLGNQVAEIIETPGHTLGHIVYYFRASNALFCGDTLFSMGCGRLLEGTAEQLWHSLQQLKNLPKNTQIYCSHEYTQANGKFALSLEPNSLPLKQRIQQVNQLRSNNKATIPSTLEQELATNPFLREDSPVIQQSINMLGRPATEIFKKIRELKDNF